MPRIFMHEINANDVGKTMIKLPAKLVNTKGKFIKQTCVIINTYDLMGRIIERDIGKRIYKIDDVYQVENDQQLAERLKQCHK